MADKRYYWLKLQEDFFNSKRIKKLRRLAGGDTFTIIYLKMQLLSLRKGGYIEFSGLEEEFASEIALDIDEDDENVKITIQYLISCGLLETTDNIEYFLPFVAQCTGSETKWAEKKRKYRSKDTEIRTIEGQCPREIEIEKDIDIDIYNNAQKDAQNDAQGHKKDTKDNAQFEELWCAYPRKKDKARAHSCYNARLKDGWSHEELMQAVENYAEECKKERTDTKYIKHPSTFLSASTPFVDYLRKGDDDGSRVAGHVEGNALTDEQLDRILNGCDEDDELSQMFG